jgi:hypothetical protein
MKTKYYFEKYVVRYGSTVTSNFGLNFLCYFEPKGKWWYPILEPSRVFKVTRVPTNPCCLIKDMRPLRTYLRNTIADDLQFLPSRPDGASLI